ncbi:30S ribosomal protein S7 [bacterium]|jgi:small subunit ribosomal protein S7|nr:30S ribosomal protein S7 [bacterium]
MPRRKTVDLKRNIPADYKYGSVLVQKLINVVMERGKKNTARSVVYGALIEVASKIKGDEKKAIDLFNKAYDQIVPQIEVRPRRVGGSVYQIPVEVIPRRKEALALRWLISAAKSRPDKAMTIRLAREILDASEGRGSAVKKRIDMHKMADANRAFSHYAW